MDISLDNYIKLKNIRRPNNVTRGRQTLKTRIAQKIIARSRQFAFGRQRMGTGRMRPFKFTGNTSFQRRYRTPVQAKVAFLKRRQHLITNVLGAQRQRGSKWFWIHKKIQRAQQFQQQQQRQYVPWRMGQVQQKQTFFKKAMQVPLARQRQVPARQLQQQRYLPQLQVTSTANRQSVKNQSNTFNTLRKRIQTSKAQQRRRRMSSAFQTLTQASNLGSGLKVSIKNELTNRVKRAKRLQNLRNKFRNVVGPSLPNTTGQEMFVGPARKRGRRQVRGPQAFMQQTKTYFTEEDVEEVESQLRCVNNLHPYVQATAFTMDERFSSQ